MTLSPRLQKPSAQPRVTQGPTGAEILGQVTESALCWTIPGYVFSAYNIGLAWMIAFTRAEKPAKEADSPL